MFKSVLKTLGVLACSGIYAASAQAIQWSASTHKVLQGDYNGDGITDLYVAARSQPVVLPLNGLSTLVVPRHQHSFVLQSAAGGQYTVLRPLDLQRIAQVAWTPAPYSFLVGDYNGDGLPDLLLRPDASGQEGLLLTQNAAGVPAVVQTLNSQQLGIELSTAGGYQLQWMDVNGDGKADLLMRKAGFSSQMLLAGASGFAAAQVYRPGPPPQIPVGDQPLDANAWGLAEGGAQVTLDGRLAYSVPLEMPVGVNGLQPSLTLGYQMGARDGYLGAGWGLSGLSSIQRCPATIAQDQYSGAPSGSSADKLCLDGQRLHLVSGTEWQPGSVYRTEIDAFAQVTLKGSASDPYFELRAKNGWIMSLGKTSASRVIPLGGKPLAWLLDTIEDRFGNKLGVSYSSSGGMLLPASISYAGAKVQFFYRARSDAPKQFALGGELKFDKLLERVATYGPDGAQLREYRIGYQYSANTRLPRIAHVQPCGVMEGERQCLAATAYAYLDQPNRLENGQLLAARQPMATKLLSTETTIDWNGDGHNDLLTVNFNAIYVALGGANGLGVNTKVASPTAGWSFLTASPVDVNGDGKQEVLYLAAKTGKPPAPNELAWTVQDAQGVTKTVAAWTAADYKGVITNFSGSIATSGVLTTAARAVALDFSHDGRPDLLLPVNGSWQLYENKPGSPSGFLASSRLSGLTVSATGTPWLTPFSLEGDGKWQLLTTVNTNGTQRFAVLPVPRQGTVSASQKIDLGIAAERAVLLDANGDGLLDFATPNSANQIVLYLNKGGAAAAANFQQQVAGQSSAGIFAATDIRRDNKDYLPKPIDFDGDGRQDLLYINHATQRYEVLRSVGTGFETAPVSIPLVVAVESYNTALTNCANYPKTHASQLATINSVPESDLKSLMIGTLAVMDVNCEYIPAGPLTASNQSLIGDWSGDGQEDLLLAAQSNGQYLWRLHRQARQHDEWLSSATDSLGNQTQVTYKPLNDSGLYQGRSDAVFPQLDWRGPRYAVSQLMQSNGIGGFNESQFEYRDARIDLLGRGFLGFAQVIRKVPARKQVLTSKLRQDFPYIGALSEETLVIDGKTIGRKSLEYQSTASGKLYVVAPKAVNEERFELDGQAVGATHQQYQYDMTTGNLLEESSEQRPSLAGAWVQRSQIKRQYQDDTASWLLGFVTREEQVLEASGVPAQTTVTQRTPRPGTLAVASEVRFVGNADLQQSIAYSYDAQGNPSSITTSAANAGSQTQRFEDYQSQRFPRRLVNALGHKVQRSYNAGSGQVLSSTDANGLTTYTGYDGFGRLLAQIDPDGSQQVTEYQGCSSVCLLNERFRVNIQTQGAPVQRVHYDSLGRTLREARQGFAGGDIYVDRQYDALGRLTRETLPYSAGSSALASLYRYDDLDRLLEVQAPDDTLITNTFAARSGGGTTLSKARQFSREGQSQNQLEVRKHDAAGRLVLSTNAANSAQAVSIAYQYDSAGNLLRTEVNNNPRTAIVMTYDLAGNRITQHDPNAGRMTYRFDAFGRVREVTAPGVRTQLDYDALGRLTARLDYQGAKQVDAATWEYDQGGHAIGKLTGLFKADRSFVQGYLYDSQGRLQARGTDITVAGTTKNYTTTYGYDTFSRPLTTTWASGFGLRQRYNGQGYLEGESSLDGSQSYRSIEAQNARGQNTRVRYGNGVVSDYRYDDAGGWLTELDSSGGTGVLQQLRYSYDPIGLLTSREDQRGGYREHFDYDALQRLRASQRQLGSTAQNDSYAYDALGNLLRTPHIGAVNYSQYDATAQASCTALGAVAQPGPHAALQSSQGAYCYDARGNQIAGPNRRISYSVDNKPLVITRNGQASTFSYDPDRQRFYQSNGSRSTYYLDEGQFEEISENGQVKQNTYAAGYLQHQKNLGSGTSTLKYQLNDQLGSVDVVLDARGQPLERLAYAPFGGRRGANWSNTAALMQESRRGFTGHEHLEESQLIHMNGRVYDPALGRFLSSDIVYQDATNAQMFNRYAYGFNSPFSGTDPSGYVWYDPFSWDWAGTRNQDIPGQSFFDPTPTYGPWANGYGLGQDITPYGAGQFSTELGERFSNAIFKGSFDTNAGVSAWALGYTNALKFGGLEASGQYLRENPAFGATRELAGGGILGLGGGLRSATVSVGQLVEGHFGRLFADGLGSFSTKGFIDPSKIRFSQDSIKAEFQNGLDINVVAGQLRGLNGESVAANFEPIRLVVKDGLMFTLDNRRVVTFSMASRDVPYRLATLKEIAKEWDVKFTTTELQGWGRFITVRPPKGFNSSE